MSTQSLENGLLSNEEAIERHDEWMRKSYDRDKGLISEARYQQWLKETGNKAFRQSPRVSELHFRKIQAADEVEKPQAADEVEKPPTLRIVPFRGCAKANLREMPIRPPPIVKGLSAKAKREMPRPKPVTPKPTRGRKVSACTPEFGMKEARIKAGLAACLRHPNGAGTLFIWIE